MEFHPSPSKRVRGRRIWWMSLVCLLAMATCSWAEPTNGYVVSSSGQRLSGDNLTMDFVVGQIASVRFAAESNISLQTGFLQTETGLSCCYDLVGDVDASGSELPDIADLVYLVGWLFESGPPPRCLPEANVDGDIAGEVDIADAIRLVDFMFNSGAQLAPCPEL